MDALRKICTGTAIAAVAGLMLAATPAYAVHNDGLFQLDGDVQKSVCGTSFPSYTCPSTTDDWDSLYSCPNSGELGSLCTKATPGVNNSAAAIADLVTDGVNASIFRGGGSKDEKDITQWSWTDGSSPDKDDLVQAFAAVYRPGGGNIIYFGANRISVNGDAQIGFWFFQNAVKLGPNGTFVDAAGNPAAHKVGDVLILSNFVQGGGNSNIQVYAVTFINTSGSNTACPAGSVETTAGAGDICVKQIVNGSAGLNGVCNTPTGSIPDDTACAATNGFPVSALDPRFVPKSGTAGTYPTVGFFEGGLDLEAAGLGNECFPSFAVETRSSQSITAVLKDFTLGKFEDCSATIKTEIHSAADNSDSDLQGTSINSGTSIHDLAIVTGTAGAPLPTGSVTFSLYTTADCSGTATTETIGLTAGSTNATANSTAITVTPTARSYQATYNGDNNYASVIGSCETVSVNKVTPTLTTQAQPQTAVSLGDSISDKAFLSGGIAPLGGSITFKVYGPDDATCSTTAKATSTVNVNGAGTYNSSSFTPTAAGTYRWIASYSGDTNNNPVTTSCNDAAESNLVKANPTISTNATPKTVTLGDGQSIIDSATLANVYDNGTLSGTITFNAYGPNDASCSTSVFTATATVGTGVLTYSTTGFVPSAAGTYRWIASYSGNSNNNAAGPTACNDANEANVVNKAQPGATTQPLVKVLNNDTATLSGGFNPTGTLTFNLYSASGLTPPNCTGATAYTEQVTVSGAGVYTTSNANLITLAGDTVFRWQVVYSGDGNNNGFTSTCSAEQVLIDITP